MPNSPAPKPRKRVPTPTAPRPEIVERHGRKYISEASTHSYVMPCDVREMSRQALWHELSYELYGGYSAVNFKVEKIPDKVLELGCGSAIWSACMSDEFAAMGRPDVEFIGMDLVAVHSEMKGVNFKFVKHDLTSHPLPFEDGTFEYIFSRDMMIVNSTNMDTGVVSELLRVLKPGGIFEIQCNDYIIRTLQCTSTPYIRGSSGYEITPTTQFRAIVDNPFIQKWNESVKKCLLTFNFDPLPCTLAGSSLAMEGMVGIQSKRLALPFDTTRWESSGVDSASESSSSICFKRQSTGGSSVESLPSSSKQFRKRGGSTSHQYSNRRSSVSASNTFPSPLTEDERAVRQLLKLVFAQLIEALEHVLREIDDLDQDEWDGWYRELLWNWFEGHGLRGGECMEFGAWWGKKASC